MVQDNEENGKPQEAPTTFPPVEVSRLTQSYSESGSLTEFIPAFLEAQKAIKPAELNKVNPHYQSKYADLPAVFAAVLPHLHKNDICVMQRARTEFDVEGGTRVLVATKLFHKSLQWIQVEWGAAARGSDPQAVAAVATYMKRYGLASLVGCAAEEDDDAESAYRDRGGNKSKANAQQRRRSTKKGDDKPATVKECNKFVAAFDKFGVPLEKLEEKVGKKMADWTESTLEVLRQIGAEIKTDGVAPEDIFGMDIPEPSESEQIDGKEEPGADG